jgi:hypothetical protein
VPLPELCINETADMKAIILRGTKQEIVDSIAGMTGEVHEAIVFMPETSGTPAPLMNSPSDIFLEMRPEMVAADNVDESREAIYSRMAGE